MKTRTFLSAAGFLLLAIASSNAQILQTVNSTANSSWNTQALWGSPAADPSAGNNYEMVAGLQAVTASGFGENYSTRLRDTGTTFAGASLTVPTLCEVIQKAANNTTTTTSANLIFAGGIFCYGNGGPSTVNLAGTLNVSTSGLLGMGGNNILNVQSTLTGSSSSILYLSASDTTPTINFAGNDTGYAGNFQIGDNGAAGYVTVDFESALNSAASITMDTVGASQDVLDLSTAITVSSFDFDGTELGAGTYTAAELNGDDVGDGSQFTGGGTLTITPVPEPSAVLLGSLGALLLFFKRGLSRRTV